MLVKKINKYFPFIIISFLASDFLASISYKLFYPQLYRFSGSVKLLVGVLLTVLIITHLKQSTTLKIAFLLIITFVVGQYFSLKTNNILEEFLQGNIYFFSRYMYIMLIIIFFNTFKIEGKALNKTYYFFESFLWLNSFLIILGFLFHIQFFKSFFINKERFGYLGLFSSPGEGSYLYMLAIIFNYYKWKTLKKNKNRIKIIALISISLLLGQKKIFLFLFLLAVIHFYNSYKKTTIVSVPILITIFVIFSKEIINFVLKPFIYWKKFVQEAGLLTAITSYRNVLLEKTIVFVQEKWKPINYIFGGINFEIYKTEFGFFDIFFFFGFFGILYYLHVFSMFIKHQIKETRMLISILFITSFFGGGLLLYPTVTTLFYITTILMRSNKNKTTSI